MAKTRRSKVNRSFLGLLSVTLFLGACGDGNFSRTYYGGPTGEPDGGMCVGPNHHACACVDEPYLLAVSLALGTNATLSDLNVDFFRQASMVATPSATAPAKGTPGADGYFIASILSQTGTPLTTLVFKDPRFAASDAGYYGRSKTDLLMTLVSGAMALHIENWDTGQVLIDLDLHGQLQLLCVDRPCLSLCQTPGLDAAVAPVGDANATDSPSTVDGEAIEVGTSGETSIGSGMPDAGARDAGSD